MPTIEDLKKTRLKKLAKIKKAGINPYPSQTKRTHTCQEALADFKKLSRSKRKIVLVGRICSIRIHGKSTFIHLADGTDKIQAYLKADVLG
ncbi:MAG TPA: lysine--tRNA ligase, partial [Candidatus Portnoybacteria bacterium]|nr:lysine--tRNA ligase [Candidatus Portnoybacteria bacterium]